MKRVFQIGTRDSELAVWQANLVKEQLALYGYDSKLVFIKSEGDLNLTTPLYAMGVQGIFTRTLDTALLNDRVDIAVHSMKDVPIQLPQNITQAAVLKRASYKDVLVHKGDTHFLDNDSSGALIATSSIRRIAQWLHRYPQHQVTSLRGNINSRLKKLKESNWNGAIFAAAGLQRIHLLPDDAVELDWMLPAPAQGAIMVVCRQNDDEVREACSYLDDQQTALCTAIERDFLKTLLGGCSTPISALALAENNHISFKGNITSPDGKQSVHVESIVPLPESQDLGIKEAYRILENGGKEIAAQIRHER